MVSVSDLYAAAGRAGLLASATIGGAEVLVDFARRNAVTQIFVARARAGSPWLRRSLLEQTVLRAKDMQVVIAGAR